MVLNFICLRSTDLNFIIFEGEHYNFILKTEYFFKSLTIVIIKQISAIEER